VNRRALTLVEIIVAVIIMAFVMLALSNLFLSGKRYIAHHRARMTGGEIGRLFLDPLQMAVRQGESASGAQDGWNQANNALTGGIIYCDGVGGHTQIPGCPTQTDRTLGTIVYNATYTITNNSPINNLKRVKLDVSWTEPTP
jgi:type II secretory pathway pseudopilin PulG